MLPDSLSPELMNVTERVLGGGDIHFPEANPVAIEQFLGYAKLTQPNQIVLLGDLLDFYALSKFDKDPKRILSLQLELDQLYRFLAKLRTDNPSADITYILGNHESRLQKFLWRHPELSSLASLGFEQLLKLDDHRIKLEPVCHRVWDWVITHGTRLGIRSGMSAHKELTKWRRNGISGHSHRLCTYHQTDGSGTYTWLENGCLCSLSPDYEHCPDWQLGFSEILRFSDGSTRAVQHPIINGAGRPTMTETATAKP